MKAFRILILLLFFAGCEKVRTEYDQAIDFGQYTSFCWLEGCVFSFTGPAYLNDSLIQLQVKNAIMTALKKKGLHYNNNDPDLLVDFHITIENEKVVYYHGIQDDPYYYRTTFLQPEELQLTKGSLIIHMVDRDKSVVVWQSQAEGYLDDPPDLSEKNIQKGITRILRDFPPVKRGR